MAVTPLITEDQMDELHDRLKVHLDREVEAMFLKLVPPAVGATADPDTVYVVVEDRHDSLRRNVVAFLDADVAHATAREYQRIRPDIAYWVDEVELRTQAD